jgi:hypothetical protein
MALQVFAAKKSVDFPEWLIVTCPHEDCGNSFLVKAKPWRNTRKTYTDRLNREYTVTGRPCPYCSRASHMPSRGKRA